MDGVWCLSPEFDTVGAMAKSVVDLATVTEILLSTTHQSPPERELSSFLTKSFEGLRVGFLDPKEWHFPPEACPQIEEVVKQLVK